jgi:hypothetical protein
MKRLSWLFLMVVLILSCQDDQDGQSLKEVTNETIKIDRSALAARLTTPNGINCFESTSFILTVNNMDQGSGSMTINENDIAVSFDLTGSEWFFLNVKAWVGHCDSVPATSEFPYTASFTVENEVRTGSLTIPTAPHPDCGCIYAVATAARFSPINSQLESYESGGSTEYCNCDEPDEPEPDDKNLRTQTPGGWGAPPNGDNPGAYLHANFNSAFPGGLVVGCNYTITLTSAQAVTNCLPQGGTSGALTKNYLNPVNTPKSSNNPKNVLASHVIALTLSTAFDSWDEDFGESNTNLSNALITTGTFEGWTVGDVLAEAEKVLGGCGSSYSAAQLTEVLTAINECYVDGTSNTGFLKNQ